MDTDDLEARQLDWDRSAPGWEAWFDTIETASRAVSERLVELAALGPGDRVLDLATGIGEPAITAARRVAPGGQVTATDISATMVAAARRRAATLGVGNVSFHVLAIEQLDLPPGSCDAALCRWGLMFVPDLDAAVRRIRAALRPGGRFAASAWAGPAAVPFLGLERVALARYFEADHFRCGPDQLDAFRLSGPGVLESVLSGAGFADVTCERVDVVYTFASADEYVRFRRAVSSSADALLHRYPESVAETAWRELADCVADRADPEGRIRLENTALCVAGSA